MDNCAYTKQVQTIPMAAFGKARPRMTRRGRAYMPKAYQDSRRALKAMFGPVMVDGLVKLEVVAWRKLPKHTQNKHGDWCMAGPDADNILGAVMDALFDQDNVVVQVSCAKFWGHDHELVITIQGVG